MKSKHTPGPWTTYKGMDKRPRTRERDPRPDPHTNTEAMIYTKKLSKGTHGPSGQTAIHMEGRGLVAVMEAGNQSTRDHDAEEIVRRWNAHEAQVIALRKVGQEFSAHRNESSNAAHAFQLVQQALEAAGQPRIRTNDNH